MILARVVAPVVAPPRHEGLGPGRLLAVRPVDTEDRPCGVGVVAMDLVDAGIGDLVLVNKEGSSARFLLNDPANPAQAVIVGVVDRVEKENSP